MTEILFWAAAAVLFYTYVGYGLLAALLVRLRGDRPAPAPFAEADLPAITVVVAAYNEAAWIEEKVRTTLALDYPADKLRLLVVADGSTDGTEALARAAGAEVLFEPARNGKVAAMNRAMVHVTTPLVAFTDANARLAPDALRHLVAPFAEAEVGAVAGEKRVDTSASGTATVSAGSAGSSPQAPRARTRRRGQNRRSGRTGGSRGGRDRTRAARRGAGPPAKRRAETVRPPSTP